MPENGKRIKDFPCATTLTNADALIIDQTDETKYVTVETLVQTVLAALPQYVGEVQ